MAKSLKELINNIDFWVGELYEDDGYEYDEYDDEFQSEDELKRIEKEWVKEIIEMYNSDNIEGGVVLYNMMGFSSNEMIKFYQSQSEDLKTSFIEKVMADVKQKYQGH